MLIATITFDAERCAPPLLIYFFRPYATLYAFLSDATRLRLNTPYHNGDLRYCHGHHTVVRHTIREHRGDKIRCYAAAADIA